jgi:general secretion pathway protein A
LFLDPYRLRGNPFAPGAAKPWISSLGALDANRKLDELIGGQIQCLLLSGPAGVGKSALLRRRLRGLTQGDVCWVPAGVQAPEAQLGQLIDALGLGMIDGTLSELRNIVAVYLQHQAGQSRQTFIVADDVERLPATVLQELEHLARLRWKHRPVAQLVLATSNEELIRDLLPHVEGGPHARAAHCRLTGFSFDETQAYVRGCLDGAGCESAEQLLSPEVIIDVHAVTQGVVGSVDALCRAALELLGAHRPGSAAGVTKASLKEAAASIGLPYDPSAWIPAENPLSAESVRQTEPELRIEAARLLVWSGGRQVAEIALDRPRMVLGRDQSCDISLDSNYVSRYQNLFMEAGDAWMLFDLNSTNGCYVNGRRIREHRLRDGDLIAVGQHQLRFSCPADALDAETGGAADETLQSPRPIVGRSA